jgi:acetate---CoA ligase (ADP-forming)
MTRQVVRRSLDSLLRPRSVAIVGACPNDPTRMGTRTLYDLAGSSWNGRILPVSTRHESLYGLPVYRSLRDLPQAPDVVLARIPSAGAMSLVEDAIAVGAGHVVVLAAGFAEAGEAGRSMQHQLVARAAESGVRILGPQSIGLVNCIDGVPLSLSQIMERLVLRKGRTALLTQSGAMAISLAVRAQADLGIDFSYVVTFGNSADIAPAEALQWLARDAHTDVIGLYLEGMGEGRAFADAVLACRDAGKDVVVLRSGLSRRGAQAVASHTASMSGDADLFFALCRQLAVPVCESADRFLWTLKGLSRRANSAPVKTAFASISGGACALWADHAERLGFDLPPLTAGQHEALVKHLPSFLTPANPLDLGPVFFDEDAFAETVGTLLSLPNFDLLVLYLFTSSPSLMGGLDKVARLEQLARKHDRDIWVIWEAATEPEWAALARSARLVGFRDLGQAALALQAVREARGPIRHVGAAASPRSHRPAEPCRLDTEVAVKTWLHRYGIQIPRGFACETPADARRIAESLGGGVALKVISAQIPHKSEVGGVILIRDKSSRVDDVCEEMLASVRRSAPDAEVQGVLVEELVNEHGLELFVTVRHDQDYGLVTTIGRGGIAIEVERDYVVHVGELGTEAMESLLPRLRCAALFGAFRGRPPLAISALVDLVTKLHAAVSESDVSEVEINPVLLGTGSAWALDALVRS